jgi:hypothetical protein
VSPEDRQRREKAQAAEANRKLMLLGALHKAATEQERATILAELHKQ